MEQKRKVRILVVDDEQGPRESIRMILKDEYDVYTASDGEEALKKLMEKEIDIVAMDIKMPKTNGLELLQNIKKSVPDVEVFLITGYPSLETAMEALKFGAYDYVLKPFDKEVVRDVVRRGILRQSQNLFEKRMYLMNNRLKG